MRIALTRHGHIALGCTGAVSPHVSLGTVLSRVKGLAAGVGSLNAPVVGFTAFEDCAFATSAARHSSSLPFSRMLTDLLAVRRKVLLGVLNLNQGIAGPNFQELINWRFIEYRDLLSAEIFEDGITVTKTSRLSQAGGLIIGGALLGGGGALTGALSAKTSSSAAKTKQIDLRLIVNDLQNPVHDVNFLNVEVKNGSFLYNDAIRKARHWNGLIDVLISRAATVQPG